MATNALDPAGVDCGTSNGSVYASHDESETWRCIARGTAGDFLDRNHDDALMRAPAVVRLPFLPTTSFPDAERIVWIEADTVGDERARGASSRHNSPWTVSTEGVNDPTYADAIMDRIVHNAHRIELSGESMRRTRGKQAHTS